MFEQQVVLPDHVMMRDVDGQVVLVDLRSEAYFALDGSGVEIMQALLGSASIEAALQTLLTQLEVEEDELREDLQSLVEELIEAGLLVKKATR